MLSTMAGTALSSIPEEEEGGSRETKGEGGRGMGGEAMVRALGNLWNVFRRMKEARESA